MFIFTFTNTQSGTPCELLLDNESADFEQQAKAVWHAAQQELQAGGIAKQFLAHRGISFETAVKAGCGFCAFINFRKLNADGSVWNSPKNAAIIFPKFWHAPKRDAETGEILRRKDKDGKIVLPVKPIFDVTTPPNEICGLKWRYFDPQTFGTPEGVKSKAVGYGTQGLQGLRFLNEPKECAVVEGEFDYLTFLESGTNCIGLGGTSGAKMFVEHLKGRQIAAPLILALDNDKAPADNPDAHKGLETQNELFTKFKHPTDFAGVQVLAAPFFHDQSAVELNNFFTANKIKDANDLLQLDVKQGGDVGRKILLARINELRELCAVPINFAAKLDPDDPSLLKAGQWQILNLHGYKETLQQRRLELQNAPHYPTPFKELNDILDGGMRPKELYVFGATSGAGKTDFALQLAEFVAKNGANVVYLTLEVPTEQCEARILSRRAHFLGVGKPVTHYLRPFDADAANIYERLQADVGGRLFIVEGAFADATVEQLDDYLTRFNARRERPLVVLDYLQIIKTERFLDSNASDKQITDDVVKKLKQVANKHAVPILLISSFGRSSYNSEPTMAAFKESGIIEYTAENLWVFDYAQESHDLEKVYTADDVTKEGKRKKLSAAELRRRLKKQFERETAEGRHGVLALKILKNRNGKSGVAIRLYYNKMRHTFFANDPTGAKFDADGNLLNAAMPQTPSTTYYGDDDDVPQFAAPQSTDDEVDSEC